MQAYIKLGGHQHKVEKDQVILSELTGQEVGKEFTVSDVLMTINGKDVKVGQPIVSGASVTLKVLDQVRAPKIEGFKYKRRKGYRRQWGHRQNLHRLQVVSIKG